MIDKKALFGQLIAKLEPMIASAEEGRKDAQAEANLHGGAMISRYDTFKEEAQYLAGAQLKRATELKEAK